MNNSYDNVWIVIPAFNEHQVIGKTVSEVRTVFRNVVVVDDASKDATAQQALEHGATVVTHPVNLGQGAALQTGLAFALKNSAALIVTFDADGQHDIADVLPMLARIREKNLDVVLGSRFKGKTLNMPLGRRLLLKAAVFFTRMSTGLRLTDSHNGLRVLTAAAAHRIHLRQNRMAHASEILDQIASFKMKYEEMGNTVRYTDYSMAKGQKASNAINILIDLWIGRMGK